MLERNMSCPNCGSTDHEIVDAKYIVTELRRCLSCRLLFRCPSDDEARNRDFYNGEYTQGFTTELPDERTLQSHMTHAFRDTEKDYSRYIDVLIRLGTDRGARLFDFGCSWGYGSWQLKRAGYSVWASDISEAHRDYASEMLNVRVVNVDDIGPDVIGTFDCFFSAHVLEHVPVPSAVFRLAARLLRPGGLFVSFTPNGSSDCRLTEKSWSKLWGQVHPNFIDDEFLDRSFAGCPRIFLSLPATSHELEQLVLPDEPISRRLTLSRAELLFVARMIGGGVADGERV
jgi:2-polyprenyl-3-methyl-5-hydroxy-6-metoxy-1,4-benzoquinol methylase